MNYIVLIEYGEDFGKLTYQAKNDKDALVEAKRLAQEYDGTVVSVVQGKSYETGRVVS